MLDNDTGLTDSLLAPLAQLRHCLERHPQVRRWCVAYSGGLDSSLLLQALVHLQPRQPILALHVHHGLSPNADAWAEHCRRQCQQLGVTCQVARVEVQAAGRGPEEAARRARYDYFAGQLAPGDALLLAHHRDDQAETLLLHLMRGSGARGLAAMAAARPFARGWLLRPWLALGRADLERLARDWQLAWIEDESNRSLDFDRNYLRHRVLPLLQQRWPGFAGRWQQSAELLRDYDQLAEQVAADDLQRAEPRRERLGQSVALAPLQALDGFRRGNLLRLWLAQMALPLPQRVQLQELEQQLLAVSAAAGAEVSWGHRGEEGKTLGHGGRVRVRRFRERLYVLPDLPACADKVQRWSGQSPLAWGGWRLRLVAVEKGGFALPQQGFDIGPRRPGDRCRPAWRAHSQTLKKLLQEAGLAPWLRDRVPILRNPVSGEIVAVGDLWVCAGYVQAGPGYRLVWEAE